MKLFVSDKIRVAGQTYVVTRSTNGDLLVGDYVVTVDGIVYLDTTAEVLRAGLKDAEENWVLLFPVPAQATERATA